MTAGSGESLPDYLILDGQQRLTSMYRVTVSKDPVDTKTDKGKDVPIADKGAEQTVRLYGVSLE